jgi:hypothetical protein
MANTDAPNGMRAVKAKYGTAPQRRKYLVKATTTIFEGAPVCFNTTGNIVAYTTTLAIAGQVAGVADQYVNTADADRSIYVLDDVNQLFEMQSDDNSLTALTDYLGKLFLFTNAVTGHTTLLHSKSEINGDTGTSVLGTAATNIHPIQVIGESQQVGNTVKILHSRYQVRFMPQVHAFGTPPTGIS